MKIFFYKHAFLLGTGINDLVRWIFVGSDSNIRRKHLSEWIELYLISFNESTSKLNLPITTTKLLYENSTEIHKIFEENLHYEIAFLLFLGINNLDGSTNIPVNIEDKKKLLHRMIDLVEDYKHIF